MLCPAPPASYLPRPGPVEYQFVYVDATGEVCARSSPFSFCSPKPLDELVTLEQERDGDEDVEDILLVVPRAELLQVGPWGGRGWGWRVGLGTGPGLGRGGYARDGACEYGMRWGWGRVEWISVDLVSYLKWGRRKCVYLTIYR